MIRKGVTKGVTDERGDRRNVPQRRNRVRTRAHCFPDVPGFFDYADPNGHSRSNPAR